MGVEGAGQLLGYTIEQQLSSALHSLILGRLELWQCTPSLAGIYTLAYDAGRTSRDAEISDLRRRLARAEHERDLAYTRLHNPGQRLHETIQDRIDAASLAIESQGLPQSEVRFFEAVLEHAIDLKPRRNAA